MAYIHVDIEGDGAAAKLETVKQLIRTMRWQDVEKLASDIEAQRICDGGKECRRKVTGNVLYHACGGEL